MCIDHQRYSYRDVRNSLSYSLMFRSFLFMVLRIQSLYIWHCSSASGGVLRLNTQNNMGSRWGLLPLYLYPICGGRVEWNDKWPRDDSCLGVLCFRLPVQAPSTRSRITDFIRKDRVDPNYDRFFDFELLFTVGIFTSALNITSN